MESVANRKTTGNSCYRVPQVPPSPKKGSVGVGMLGIPFIGNKTCQCSLVCLFLRVLVSWFFGFLVSSFLGFLVSWFFAFLASWFLRFTISKFQNFGDTKIIPCRLKDAAQITEFQFHTFWKILIPYSIFSQSITRLFRTVQPTPSPNF